MAQSLQALHDQVVAWLNRGDIDDKLPGWIAAVETDIAESLRARCMVVRGDQAMDADTVTMPANFCSMESIRYADTGELLTLEDEWTGHWADTCGTGPTGYRLVGNCVEWLPHPIIPDPPDPSWTPRIVRMGWYAKPDPLVLPSDTNAVLENLFTVYLFGACRYGAMYEMDAARADQMKAAWQEAVTAANMWKTFSDYSGAPLREAPARAAF